MGTCPSAYGAVERSGPGGSHAQAAPAYGEGRVVKRAAKERKDLTNGGADEDEEEDLEAQAVRRALLSGVQRWCLDVSEWGELSTDQASEINKEGRQAGRQRRCHSAERLRGYHITPRESKRQRERPNRACGACALARTGTPTI